MANFKRKHKKYNSCCGMCKYDKIHDIPRHDQKYQREWQGIKRSPSKPHECKRLKGPHQFELFKEYHSCWPKPSKICGKNSCWYYVEIRCKACNKRNTLYLLLDNNGWFSTDRYTKRDMEALENFDHPLKELFLSSISQTLQEK